VELRDTAAAGVAATPYQEHYTVDFAAGGAVYSPGYLSAQGASFLLSDMLSDHQVFVNIMTYQEGNSLGSLVNNLNATAVYLNQSQRSTGAWARSGRGGCSTRATSTRCSRNRHTADWWTCGIRCRASRGSKRSSGWRTPTAPTTRCPPIRSRPVSAPPGPGHLQLPVIRARHSLWLETGPIDGSYAQITSGVVTDLQNGRFDSWLLAADLRRYLRTSLHTAVAVRGFAFYSGGERPERVTIGGSWAVRGYPQYSYLAGDRA